MLRLDIGHDSTEKKNDRDVRFSDISHKQIQDRDEN